MLNKPQSSITRLNSQINKAMSSYDIRFLQWRSKANSITYELSELISWLRF